MAMWPPPQELQHQCAPHEQGRGHIANHGQSLIEASMITVPTRRGAEAAVVPALNALDIEHDA
ncbi:hypothetical protein ATX68_09960 [Oenococcus oeni]|nr:hypothetical protein ATX68_09960 [Oenococcus oeni]